MDPDATLAEVRLLSQRLLEESGGGLDALRLAELVESLDGWISRGGFLPSDWNEVEL